LLINVRWDIDPPAVTDSTASIVVTNLRSHAYHLKVLFGSFNGCIPIKLIEETLS